MSTFSFGDMERMGVSLDYHVPLAVLSMNEALKAVKILYLVPPLLSWRPQTWCTRGPEGTINIVALFGES